MKGPIGRCAYCGQEFMSKPGLAKHEAYNCPKRPHDPTQETVELHVEPAHETAEDEPPRWRQVTRVGGGIGWVRQ